MTTTDNTPECARWAIWEGPEVEGSTDLGAVTLFVRKGLHFPCYITEHTKRIWICKEMLNRIDSEIGRDIISALKGVRPDLKWAFEIPYSQLEHYRHLRAFGSLYVKLDLEGFLENGDTLCVGRPYNDQFFQLSSTNINRVIPEDYKNDVVREVLQ